MRLMAIAICVSAPAWAAAAQEPPAAEELARLVERAREMALRYTATLPNFICTETMRRTVRPKNSEAWKTRDTLTLDLAFTDQGESYKLLAIDGKPTRKTLKQVGGVQSTGEFGSTLKQVFQPESEARFQWQRFAKVGDAVADVFSYQVAQAHSKHELKVGYHFRHYHMTTGYHGLVYVDRETHRVLRVEDEEEGIPSNWPLVTASSVMEYGVAGIGGEKFLLPLRVERRFAERNGTQHLIVIEFKDYRKYSAEATVSFEKQ